MNENNTPITSTIKEKESHVLKALDQKRQNAVQRYPLFFTLLGAFGLVATFYGFEGIIDNIDFLANNPIILLAVGVITLAITGTLYKKLA